MSELLYNNILTIGYLVLWALTLAWYHAKRNTFDSGSFIMTMYIIYAIFSVIVINDRLFSVAFEPLTIFPYIYLYIMMMIALTPIINHHLHPTSSLEPTNTRVFIWLSILIITCSVLQLPQIISNASAGIGEILVDEGAGKEIYEETSSNAADSGGTIRNFPAVLFNMLSDVMVFLFFYFLSQKKHRLLSIGLAISIVIGIFIPITMGQRGSVIISFLTVIGAYFLFKPYLSRFVNRTIAIIGISLAIIVSIPIIAITMSRFGKENSGVTGFISWYVGQGTLYFNNYGLDAGGIRYGDRTINMVKRVIDPSTPKNYVERRDLYHNMEISDRFYTTFVGDFTLDFGPILAFMIFIAVFGALYYLTRTHQKTINTHQLLLLFFVVCISLQGGMTLFSYSDTANLRMFTIIALYVYLRYHEFLLAKYPLIKPIENDKDN